MDPDRIDDPEPTEPTEPTEPLQPLEPLGDATWEGCTDEQNLWLRVWSRCAIQTTTCKETGVTRNEVARWRTSSEAFELAFLAVRSHQVCARIEDYAIERALGLRGGKASDRLLEFLLRGADPARYGNRVEHGGHVDFVRKEVVVHVEHAERPPTEPEG